MAYTTIKVVAKYSGDLKTLVYILLMPTEMRERYKLIASRMLEVMLTGVERDPSSNSGKANFSWSKGRLSTGRYSKPCDCLERLKEGFQQP